MEAMNIDLSLASAEHLIAAPARLVVRTTPLDLPSADADPAALLDFLPAESSLSWVRRGDGLVAWGEVARIETAGDAQFSRAESAWGHLLQTMTVHDDVRAPGTGPVAFGSFSFDPASGAGGVLVVPAVVVGRRGSTAWVTTITPDTAGASPTQPTLAELLSVGAETVRSPGRVTYSPGSRTAEEWLDVVAQAVERIRSCSPARSSPARPPPSTRGGCCSGSRAATPAAGRSRSTAWSARRPSCSCAARRASRSPASWPAPSAAQATTTPTSPTPLT